MYKKSAGCLLIICFFLGCNIFKKGNSEEQVSNPKIIAEDSVELVQNYDALDSTRLVINDSILPPPTPKAPLEYMTIEEKAMIEEINLLRADPNMYIQYVDAYLTDFLNNSNLDLGTRQQEKNAGLELIRILETKAPLPLLEASEELYRVAMRHGKDMKNNEFIAHRGFDESTPEKRIRDSTHLIGSENLVGGARSVRESVIKLLVNSSDPGIREQRKIILDPSWKYIACYQAGSVKDELNIWVQLFGQDDPNDVLEKPVIRSMPEEDIEQDSLSKSKSPKPKNNQLPSESSEEYSFMTAEEKEMIIEINLMRTNPKAYIRYVDKYVLEMKEMMAGLDPDFDTAVNELKTLLRSMKPVSVLKPHRELYRVARKHGEDNKKHHQLEHQGTDGRQSFDRVKDANLKNSINNQGVYSPNENLVGGEATVRNSVLALLIDSGVPSRGHRKALTEPAWDYVACYKIGTIVDLKDLQGMENDDMDNCWVQFFAKE